MAKLQKWKPDWWLLGVKEGVGLVSKWAQPEKDNKRDSCPEENILYLDSISVNYLCVLLYYSFARCFHPTKLGERYIGYFLQLHVNL